VQLVTESDSILSRSRVGGAWAERDRMPLWLRGPLADRVAYLCGAWLQRPLQAPYAGRFQVTHLGLVWSIGVTIAPGDFGPTIDFDIPDRFELPDVSDAPVP
jgi:hypothetical protein